MTQEEIVFNIVKDCSPIRTEQVKILAMRQGVSCADRFLSWLSEPDRKMIENIGKAKPEDKTDTWRVIALLYTKKAKTNNKGDLFDVKRFSYDE